MLILVNTVTPYPTGSVFASVRLRVPHVHVVRKQKRKQMRKKKKMRDTMINA
jgi:hypothetical protein